MTKPKNDSFQEPIVLDARDLRNRAEAYASLRGPAGDRYFFVQKGPPGEGTLDMLHESAGGEAVVFELNTAAQQPARPKVVEASMRPEGGTVAADLLSYDAVFWTESAVEKFVIPYLASKSLWSAAHHVTELSRSWYGFVPDQKPQGSAQDQIPFAIGHLPDSDFETIKEPGDDLDLLFVKDGHVYAESLAQVIAKRQPKAP